MSGKEARGRSYCSISFQSMENHIPGFLFQDYCSLVFSTQAPDPHVKMSKYCYSISIFSLLVLVWEDESDTVFEMFTLKKTNVLLQKSNISNLTITASSANFTICLSLH